MRFIFESLTTDKSAVGEPVRLEFPSEPVDVILPDDIAKDMVPLSMKVGESMKIYGFRFFLNTKTLLKSLALMKGKTTVTREELDEFLALSRYLNGDFTPIYRTDSISASEMDTGCIHFRKNYSAPLCATN